MPCCSCKGSLCDRGGCRQNEKKFCVLVWPVFWLRGVNMHSLLCASEQNCLHSYFPCVCLQGGFCVTLKVLSLLSQPLPPHTAFVVESVAPPRPLTWFCLLCLILEAIRNGFCRCYWSGIPFKVFRHRKYSALVFVSNRLCMHNVICQQHDKSYTG